MTETLHKLQESIISGRTKNIVPLLKKNSRISPKKQMSVYTDGYRIRLADAIRADHPALYFYLGKIKFNRFANEFVETHRSEFYSLDKYPFKFAEFLQNKKIKLAAKELAQLESAIQQVFYAPDSVPLTPEDITKLQGGQLDDFRFKARIASAIFVFQNDVEGYLNDFRQGLLPAKIAKRTTFLYIVRHNNEVKRHLLDSYEYGLLADILSGSELDSAVIENEMAQEMLPQWLQKWLINGFFAG